MQMIQLEVWGNYALLSRPELKVERVSYEVLTPSAARGIVEAIYYHPGLRWKIRKIYVMNPIRFTNIRRNEVKSKILCSDVRSAMQGTGKELYLATPQQIVQRAAMVLQGAFAATERISGQTGSVIYVAFGKQSSGQKSEEIQRYDLLAALDA